jgi:PAS domain S-box-containing protein
LLFEHAPDAIVVLDVQARRFVRVNSMAERLFELPRAELMKKSPVEMSPERQPDGRSSAEAARAYIEQAVQGKVVVFEWRHRAMSGREVDCEVRLLRLPDPNRILVRGSIVDIGDRKRTERALRSLSQETAGVTGQAFFETSVAELARALDTHFAEVAELVHEGESTRVRTLAYWAGGAVANVTFELAGTPYATIGPNGSCHVESDAAAAFPKDARLVELGVSGYAAASITNPAGEQLGFLAVYDRRPMRDSEATRLALALAATRAAVELERLRREAAIRELNAELESRVAQRTAQLVAANQELQSFSYSVSHDLRAPLRALNGFSQALRADYSDRVDERARDYLNRIQGASERMGQLIDDLLRLSKTTRSEMRPEQVDLSALAKAVAHELAERSTDHQVEFDCHRVPPAFADRSLARILLENLLDNAWKYTRTRARGSVEFASLPEPGESGAVVYYVRDNGVGFDMAHAGRLFSPFERLHAKSEFEGSGIGLATVARIVSRHGGRVWAEAEPDRGATFYFTLRKAGGFAPSPQV